MITLIIILAVFGLSFLLEAGLVWLLCWALNAIGIMTIGGVAVAFSWPLVLVVWLVSALLRGIFKVTVNKD